MKRILLLLLPALCLVLAGCGKKTLDANNYLTVTCEGYEGNGYASLDIDYDRLTADYAKASGIKEGTDAYLALQVGLEMYVEANSNEYGLSNGDKYTIVWSIPENVAETNKVILKHDVKVGTMSGLESQPVLLQSASEVTSADIAELRAATDAKIKEYKESVKDRLEKPEMVSVNGDSDPEYAITVAKEEGGNVIAVVYYKMHVKFADGYTYGYVCGDHWEGFNIVEDWKEYPSEYEYYFPITCRYLRKDSKGKLLFDVRDIDYYDTDWPEFFCWIPGADPNDEKESLKIPCYNFYGIEETMTETFDKFKERLLNDTTLKIVE